MRAAARLQFARVRCDSEMIFEANKRNIRNNPIIASGNAAARIMLPSEEYVMPVNSSLVSFLNDEPNTIRAIDISVGVGSRSFMAGDLLVQAGAQVSEVN